MNDINWASRIARNKGNVLRQELRLPESKRRKSIPAPLKKAAEMRMFNSNRLNQLGGGCYQVKNLTS
jgi:hypothetical protein